MGIPLQSAQPLADDTVVAVKPEPGNNRDASQGGNPAGPTLRPLARTGAAKAPGRINTDSIGWYLGTMAGSPC